MSRSCSTLTRFALACAVVVGLASSAAALGSENKEELYRRAKLAEDAENLDEAARLYCHLADMDSNYKDARTNCTITRNEAARLARQYDEMFNKGVAAFQRGRLDEAEQTFKNVRGTHAEEAQKYLVKIRAANQAKAAEAAEQAAEALFQRAVQAYQRNDFAGAKPQFAQVAGKRQADAQNYLASITRYEQSVAAGDQAAAAGNFEAAISHYRAAAAVKSDGPGDLAAKIDALQNKIAAAAKPPEPPPPQSPKPGGTGADGRLAKADIPRLLREAADTQRHGDKREAKAKYQQVLVEDPNNRTAIRAIASLEGISEQTAVANRAEALLATGLRDFYAGNYEIAEVRLQDYLNADGKRKGLSYFYIGACKLTRYLISGENEEAKKLLLEAQYDFRMAAQMPKFVPPNQQYVSPRILQAYSESNR